MSGLDVLDTSSGSDNYPASLPNASACLALGIISIATCWLYAIPGIVCGIIALVLHQKDKKLYLSNRPKYEQSFKSSKAGFICGIIGLSLSAFMLVYFVVVFSFLASVMH